MLTVIINDFVGSKRVKLAFITEDFELIESVWDKSDTLLQDLQSNAMFAGRLLWRDLEPLHFRELIAKSLQHVATLSDEERLNEDNLVVSSLNFLICMMVYAMEQRLGAHIELLKLVRVGEHEVSVEFSGELQMEAAPPSKKGDTPSGITVIVDNT